MAEHISDEQGQAKKLRFEFTGSGSEYFGIWIVNILLTILTLGIYGAWAKVRNRKYFYNNTRLDGAAFDYHARPIAILKGWAIVVVLMIAYQIISSINPSIGLIVFLLILLFVPWAIIRSRVFNMYNTSYRNIRFGFKREYKEIYKILSVIPIIYLSGFALLAYSINTTEEAGTIPPLAYASFFIILISMILLPYYLFRFYKLLFTYSNFGQAGFNFQATAKKFYFIYLIALLIALVLYAVFYLTVNMIILDSPINTEEQAISAVQQYGFITATIVFFLSIFLINFYIKVATLNTIWSNAQIENNPFSSKVTLKAYIWIIISNLIMIALSIGLLTPWAKVRILRYRLSCLDILMRSDMDEFIADRQQAVGALGEELGEALDIDFAL